MKKPLIFDATPLIYLVKASLTDRFRSLDNKKILPESVYEEIRVGEEHGRPEAEVIRELVENGSLRLTKPDSLSFLNRIKKIAAEGENKPLHQAEAEALAVTKELDGVLIADDHVARSTANLMQIECHGTGYMLGSMYKERRLTLKEAIRKLTEMRRAGWRLSEDDYRAIVDYLRTL